MEAPKLPGSPMAPDQRQLKRLLLALWGSEGVGKSRFLLTTRRPTVIVSLDRALDYSGWATEFDMSDVYLYDFGGSGMSPQKVVEEVKKVAVAMAQHGRGTFCLDNGKILWDLVTDAYKDQNSKRGALAYEEPNNWMMDLHSILSGRGPGGATELSTVFTYPATDEWKTMLNPETGKETGARTGKAVPHWWSKSGYAFDGVLWLYRWPTLAGQVVPSNVPKEAERRQEVSYWARPSKFFHAANLVGSDLHNPYFGRLWFEAFGTRPPEGVWVPPKEKAVAKS